MVLVEDYEEPSSPTNDHLYDIFLSFRGVDTRNTFTAHLREALMDANYKVYYDDDEIEFGKPLKEELVNGIKASRASVIVLSQNYSSSRWCLEELELICHQYRTFNHIVFPIFYHVELTDVRKQRNSFENAMETHKQKMEAQTNVEEKRRLAEQIDTWIKALTQVANLKWKEPNGLDTKFIEEIVEEVKSRLGAPLSYQIQAPQLIGMDNFIESITTWLTDGSSHTADVLTIYGMGGIGKTSIARSVYYVHSTKFDRSSFIDNISRICQDKSNGLQELQKRLYRDISKGKAIQGHDVSAHTTAIEYALARKKVFLVLDDIDSVDQLDALLGKKIFHPGSKIIITTRDISLTKRFAFNQQVLLKELGTTQSLKLLCHHAFNSEDPKVGYEVVSYNILKYCEGLPLALVVLGKSLQYKPISYWEGCIETLKKEINPSINSVLRMSYDSLTYKNDQELFKHIACFFVGKERHFSETILAACGMVTSLGIPNLMDKCLLSIGWNNELIMHQLVQEMGRNVVGEESPNQPGMRSRIWRHKESFKVLKQKKGTDNVLGLTLDLRMVKKEILRGTDAFSSMDNLMILHLDYVQINGPYENFPEELRWLRMCGFPLKSIPSELPMENLVVLDMSYSKIEYFDMSCSNIGSLDISCSSLQRPEKRQKLTGSFSKAERLLGSLKILDLSFSEQLRGVGGFCELPSLESLFLRNCTSLIEVSESIENCDELVIVDLSYCKELRILLSTFAKLKKVENLVLHGCNMGELAIVEAVPRDLKSTGIYFPSSLVKLSLANNKLSNESFPVDFSCLSMLTYLCLDDNPIVSMPNCVRSLPRLKTLSLMNCEMLVSIEHPPRTLKELAYKFSQKSQPNILHGYKYLIQKIAFDPDMSPLRLTFPWSGLASSSVEIEGMFKIQPIAGVDDTILCSLGWRNLEFINKRRVGTYHHARGREESQTQMYYEYGIFSTIYGGEVMPTWIRRRSKGPSISFTIPSSSKKLRGLNVCYVQRPRYWRSEDQDGNFECPYNQLIYLPHIKISNITKNLTWIYKHYIERVNVGGKSLTFLSHWMLGENEMEDGDQLTVFIKHKEDFQWYDIRECGVSLVYENDDGKNEEEEDPLSYYKSWNHIIGGDLSSFQLTTGEYNLQKEDFEGYDNSKIIQFSNPFIAGHVFYKEKEPRFKAFSQRNSNTRGRAIEDVSKQK